MTIMSNPASLSIESHVLLLFDSFCVRHQLDRQNFLNRLLEVTLEDEEYIVAALGIETVSKWKQEVTKEEYLERMRALGHKITDAGDVIDP